MGVKVFINRHKFPAAIGIIVLVTSILTLISMSLYVSSGASILDLSSPALVNERKNVKKDVAPNFSTNGPLDEEAYKQFITLYNKEHQNSKDIGEFNEDVLSNESLDLTDID